MRFKIATEAIELDSNPSSKSSCRLNDKYWDDLSSSERNAATKLGYTQDLWDEE